MVQVDGVGLVMGHTLQRDKRAMEQVDWAATIQQAMREFEMSRQELLRWVSHRTSLQVACELFGIALSPSIATRFTPSDVDLLMSLGDLLWEAGLPVPRLMEHHRVQYVPRGVTSMGFSLSKEDYLRERASGKSKNRIAREQGISGPALFHWIHKWGLQDARVEAEEIERLQLRVRAKAVGHETGTERSASVLPGPGERPVHLLPSPAPAQNPPQVLEHPPSTAAARTMHPNEGRTADKVVQVAVRLPCRLPAPDAASTPTSPTAAAELPATRDERMQFALRLLAECVEIAHQDLVDMLGPDVAAAQIQRYVDRQLERCFGPGAARP
ncbi:MAG: hypothetical protein K6T78_14775 [Alicyclobacillus sp.]|nr:hypothetical protein [Alicyclobacillus sp.]